MSDLTFIPATTTTIDTQSDLDLDVVLQGMVSAITGIPGTYVRPRWQPIVQPNQPPVNVDWCAIGVISAEPADYPYEKFVADLDYELQRQERLEIMASFFGPHAMLRATNLRDGLYIWQNRTALGDLGMRLMDVQTPRNAPVLVNTQWLRRVDVTIRMVRRVDTTVPVRQIIAADIDIISNVGTNEVLVGITPASQFPTLDYSNPSNIGLYFLMAQPYSIAVTLTPATSLDFSDSGNSSLIVIR